MLGSLLLIFLSISIAVGGQLCLKIGMDQVGKVAIVGISSAASFAKGVVTTPLVVFGLFLYALSAGIWLVVLSRVELSFAYPMVGLSYVLVVLLSAVFLGEHVSAVRWLGALVILAGVVLISRT